MNSIEKFEYWKKNCKDELILAQLSQLEGDNDAIENAFYKDVEFGTAGIRGIIGAGTNCLNIYTVARITKGIAEYMKTKHLNTVGICRDSRNFSDDFTYIAARVFAENGITVTLTRDIMPTPFLSYMVRTLKLDMGVMITASHNPPNYNGYKIYNSNGYQLTDEAALDIADFLNRVDIFGNPYDSLEKYIKDDKIKYINDKLIDSYVDEVAKKNLNSAQGLSVVYSPLNGTGYKLVPQILKRIGIIDLKIVEEQGYPDGNFPTCKYPNPEKPQALQLAIDLAKKHSYDIVLATDPDADRIAVAVKHNGEYLLITGNEIGILLTDYVFYFLNQQKRLPQNPLLIKSIVTTPLAAEVAKGYGGECLDVLTGFKYIGEKITELEKNGEADRFVLGFEESYGYLCGTHVRDKDAIVAAMLISEMAAQYKKDKKTLIDRLNELYGKFGTYEHKLISYEYPGAAGSKLMATLLDSFWKNPPKILAGSEVISVIDYINDDTGLPRALVLKLDTKMGSRLIVRPSGTEPLIKFYVTASKTKRENKIQIEEISREIEKHFKSK